jgi:Putative bacterial sensory transduction regulator
VRVNPEQTAAVALLERWTASIALDHPVVTSVERDPEVDRWYVRAHGDAKLVTTVWFTVRERTLHFESYFLPTPEENAGPFYEYLLRTNARLYDMRFSIGGEDATYLTGLVPLVGVLAGGDAELDRILGSVYAASEECFATAGRIGFPKRF